MKIELKLKSYQYLTITTLWANSADDKLMTLFLIFQENGI